MGRCAGYRRVRVGQSRGDGQRAASVLTVKHMRTKREVDVWSRTSVRAGTWDMECVSALTASDGGGDENDEKKRKDGEEASGTLLVIIRGRRHGPCGCADNDVGGNESEPGSARSGGGKLMSASSTRSGGFDPALIAQSGQRELEIITPHGY